MEIKLDIGKNIHDELNEFSEIDGKNYESFAIDMLSRPGTKDRALRSKVEPII